jgi:hypothetical protein
MDQHLLPAIYARDALIDDTLEHFKDHELLLVLRCPDACSITLIAGAMFPVG